MPFVSSSLLQVVAQLLLLLLLLRMRRWRLLVLLQTANTQWILPTACFNTSTLLKDTDEADVGDWSSICSAAAATATPKTCSSIFKEQPQYSCSFKSLSSFYQIQQEIRSKGAVVTRCDYSMLCLMQHLLFA
jgi:hypothetical protein